MGFSGQIRLALFAFAALGLALVATSSSFDSRPVPGVSAQAQATATVLAARTWVPGAPAAATPAVPVNPDPVATTTAPESGGSMTANLGGSDVAVSSVGGSYEVDGPKRKAKKILKLTPTP
jgi:hypothetical protein